ncbi:MAG: hypothetical protein A2176_07795 [Spirochaetes bacterium RBG_13_51_14]|nr:MAG: hypothetical protein A2176_07795 [Spirochaetes bacterium RBG_13_51_14]
MMESAWESEITRLFNTGALPLLPLSQSNKIARKSFALLHETVNVKVVVMIKKIANNLFIS